MNENNAINFLLFSYWGITLDDTSDEKIICAAVKRAYRDASSHVFSIKSKSEKERIIIKDEAIKKITEWVEHLLTNGSTNYETLHKNICQKLTEYYSEEIKKIEKIDPTKDNKEFTYGMAQKWINMTMKYLYVIKSIFTQYGHKEILNNLSDELEHYLHVPIDSYILESVYNPKETSESPSVKITSWSKCDSNDYQELQKHIKEKCIKNESILDWEGHTWIEIAQARKKHEEDALHKKYNI